MPRENLGKFLKEFENTSAFGPSYAFFVKMRDTLTQVNYEISSRNIDQLLADPSETRSREQIEHELRTAAEAHAEEQAYCMAIATLHTSMVQYLIHKGVLDEGDRLLHATFVEESFDSLLNAANRHLNDPSA